MTESFKVAALNEEIKILPWQWDIIRNMNHGAEIEAWIRAHMTVIDVLPKPVPIPDAATLISDINRSNLVGYLDRLGSLFREQQHRVAQDTKVPKLRGLSYGPYSVLIDEANHITEGDSRSARWGIVAESDTVQLTEWLQRRGVCSRALSCSIP